MLPTTEILSLLSIDDLVHRMTSAELLVGWKVLPEIGPDWCGGGRFVDFELGEQPIDEACPVFELLANALIDVLGIPVYNEPEVLSGEGEILLREDGWLWVDYEWSKAAPYEYGEGGSGEAKLLATAPRPGRDDSTVGG